ncbi:MAG: sigma-54 dependent transcriptional regulator [Chloroflexota bacterium]
MKPSILVVDDEEKALHNISTYLINIGYEVDTATTLEEARKSILNARHDILVLDVMLPDGYGPSLLDETAHIPNKPLIIMITGQGDIEMAVDAMQAGAHDFIPKPIKFERLEKSISRAQNYIALRHELDVLRQQQFTEHDFIVGNTPKVRQVMEEAQRAASASASVLLTGETGTGKDVLSQAIIKMGPRADKPALAINCGAIQPTMVESELFGHEQGAFTGADKRKHGLMELADTGTLFLDEISAMPVDVQAKLLRALDQKVIRRVGGTNWIKVDVHIIAASNRDIPKMIEEGTFREDLYYRLKVFDIHLPSLHERKEDIPLFVATFINEHNRRFGKNVVDITPRAMEALMAHNWPGNIRQLHHVLERAVLLCDDPNIDLSHLPAELAKTSN